ncbi:Hint domain-containing protein [Roseinatronobacter alkalisoli]|uniref:Hint domain-containing protein n=1 Tax=Roseinatronobacter alkalisoli TaxID=3028235 RepID=A0ABT5T7J5_9RHOB|nr:Hint domain-containing protein [Roseinatronobacter sp. HJB301]MDD7971096.1 Hint domain-containing protein [Roseinatronobacter sp. HJB301]
MTRAAPLTGVFALDWNSTETDGVSGLDPRWLRAGARWCWTGDVQCLDARTDVLRLGRANGYRDIRQRARQVAARLGGHELPPEDMPLQPAAPVMGFVLTDGHAVYTARLVHAAGHWVAVFEDGMPPQAQPLYVVESAIDTGRCETDAAAAPLQQGVVCFADDTLISTPTGPRPVHQLCAGDLVLTQDDGPQPVVWTGTSRLSGMALRRYPHLRPVRLRRDVLGTGQPDDDLRVSPGHRLLMRGARARALFNIDEVLVRACDLLDHGGVTQDAALHGITYMHVLLERHQIIFANNVPTESFHPGFAAPELLRSHRASLRAVLPELEQGPASYGDTARRCLGVAETALLAA